MARFLARPKPPAPAPDRASAPAASPATSPLPSPAEAPATPPAHDRGALDALGRAVTSPMLDTAAETDPWLPQPGEEDEGEPPPSATPATPRRR